MKDLHKEFDERFLGGKGEMFGKLVPVVWHTKDEIKAFIDDFYLPKQEVKAAIEKNTNETLWGEDDSNEVMRISIENYKAALLSDLGLQD